MEQIKEALILQIDMLLQELEVINEVQFINKQDKGSAIGEHVDHIIGCCDTLLKASPGDRVDYGDRFRNVQARKDLVYAKALIISIRKRIINLSDEFMKSNFTLVRKYMNDDMYVYSATGEVLLAGQEQHALHHNGVIRYLLEAQNILLHDKNFGLDHGTVVESAQ